ncbi:MAG TPA: RNA polymerase sigma factor [Planctomycetota bacterium]
MHPESHPLADELANHTTFLRALARGMLADEHLADDLVQQTFLRALARPPARAGTLRAWLGTVARNLALNQRREGERRRAREALAARPEVDASAERAALELGLQREVAAALAELDEPYRTVIHLRYFRGLAPAQIAQELGLPLKTVETRLTRAHTRLRDRLTRAWREQDGRARALWLASMPAGQGIGVALMTKSLVGIGLGGVLLVGIVLTWRDVARGPEAVASSTPPRETLAGAGPVPQTPPPEAREARPAELPAAQAAPASAPEESAERARLRQTLERLSDVLDRSLDGRLDPGAILDAALLVAGHDVGTPVPELQIDGTLAIPLVGLPDGVSAELRVGDPRKNVPLRLTIHLPRETPFAHGGFERGGSTVHVMTRLDDSGEPRTFSLLTDVDLTEEAEARGHAGAFQYTFATSFRSSLTDPGDWTLEMTDNVGQPLPDGMQHRLVHSASPHGLEGGPWPRIDDVRRLGVRLQELHDMAKQRAAR